VLSVIRPVIETGIHQHLADRLRLRRGESVRDPELGRARRLRLIGGGGQQRREMIVGTAHLAAGERVEQEVCVQALDLRRRRLAITLAVPRRRACRRVGSRPSRAEASLLLVHVQKSGPAPESGISLTSASLACDAPAPVAASLVALRKAAITRSTAPGSVNSTRALSPSTGDACSALVGSPSRRRRAQRESHGFLEGRRRWPQPAGLGGRPRG
jgi:hypothetical protein